MYLERNRHPAGRLNNMAFGMYTIIDGLVRVVSCGFLHTTLTLAFARKTAAKRIQKLKVR